MDNLNDIAEYMRKAIDEEMNNAFLSMFSPHNTKPKEVNLIDEIHRMKDKLTTVVICNSDEQEELQAAANKENGFWKIIGTSYMAKEQAVIIKDEKLKMSILQGERIKNQK